MMYGLLIIEVWVQDGWILTKFFCVFMDHDRVEVHKLAKKEQGQYPDILTEQAWLVKDNYYRVLVKLFLWDTAGSPEWAT